MLSQQKASIETQTDFASAPPEHHKRGQGATQPDALDVETILSEFWVGLAIYQTSEKHVKIGIAIHDGTYSVDFAVHQICPHTKLSEEEQGQAIESHILSSLAKYRREHACKLLGTGVTADLDSTAPYLCSRLWSELDIVPVVFKITAILGEDAPAENVDELADSMARKCLAIYGPTKEPRIAINYRNQVQVDRAGQIRLTTTEDYQRSVRKPTWRAAQKYIKAVKDRKLRIVFFSATPQGGGVALMRHALLRFLCNEGVNIEWFVPKPRPDVFRITKTNHNILQGAVGPDVRSSDEQLGKIKSWIVDNAERFWLKEGGPLRPSSEGGADVIIVDDPQMPELIPIAKSQDPDRTVIFRSHIEVRDDLVREEGSAAQHVWNVLWQSIKKADMFVSHPVRSFVPSDVRLTETAWLPATTDWLDGLNKDMQDWDVKYYLHTFRQQCREQRLPELAYPKRPYITQIARFDPSKGIPDVIRSYAKLREMLKDVPAKQSPQLVICGHSSVDDPDGSMIYDQTMSLVHDEFLQYTEDIIVARLPPSDQLLNAILSMSKVALQLSTREGFEVKVSEALHKGKPVIATQTGGIPLQIEHGKSGYLVQRHDHEAVANHLHKLFTDQKLYDEMSSYAKHHVSDEVHTVGQAVSWLYVASTAAGGKQLQPNRRWLNDMAREAVNEPYDADEPRLPRHLST